MPDLIFLAILAACLLVAYAIGYRAGRRDCPECLEPCSSAGRPGAWSRAGRRDCPECLELDARVKELEIALEDIRVEAEHVQGDIHWIARRADAALTPGNVSESALGASTINPKDCAGSR